MSISETSDLWYAYGKGWDEALRRAAFICRDAAINAPNPLLACDDAADQIEALIKTRDPA
jgi:hypothetical protein